MTLLMTSPWLHERSWTSVKTYLEQNDIVLVPVGATEQHGPHAPLMLDTGWAIGVSEAVARRTNTLAAPTLHYGWSSGHMGFPGAVTLTSETLTTVLVEICQSLMVHGFRKFILVNGDPTRLRDSVRKLLDLDFETLLVGDGESILGGAKARLEELVDKLPI